MYAQLRQRITKETELAALIRLHTPQDITDARLFAGQCVSPYKAIDEHDVWKRRGRDLLAAFALHVAYDDHFIGHTVGVLSVYVDLIARVAAELQSVELRNVLIAQHDPRQRCGWRDDDGKPTSTHPYVRAVIQTHLERPALEKYSVFIELPTYLRSPGWLD